MTNTDTAVAANEPKRPSQAYAERLLAARDKLVMASDKLDEVLASVHGKSPAPAQRAPASPVSPEYRRFFPAVERLLTDIEAEAGRLAALAEGFDRSF